jgi:hypothetical protein
MKRLTAIFAMALMVALACAAPVGAAPMAVIVIDAPAPAHFATRLGDNPPPEGDLFMVVSRYTTPLARA